MGILRRGGHTDVVTVENGQQALDAVAARGGLDAFDLVLMDLHMPIMVRPVGISGSSSSERLRIKGALRSGVIDASTFAAISGWHGGSERAEVEIPRAQGQGGRSDGGCI